jgi:hypothetical protein
MTLWNGAGATGAVSTTTQPNSSAITVVDSSGLTWRLFRSNQLADSLTTNFAFIQDDNMRTGYEIEIKSRANSSAAQGVYAPATGSPFAAATLTTAYNDPALTGRLVTIRVRATYSLTAPSAWVEPGEFLQGVVTVTSITISPTSASLAPGATQQFAATVQGTNSPSQAVTWSAPVGGSVNSSGVFTAPNTVGNAYKMRATSVQDPSVFSEATITVTAVVTPPVPGGSDPLDSFSIDRQFGGLIGSNEIVVATLKDVLGQPVPGVAVGATSAKTGIATATGGVTDSNGRVSISANYVSVGLTSITLSASRAGSTVTSDAYSCFVQPVLVSGDVATIEAADTNPKFSSELYPYVFDFSEFLGPGESLIEIISTTSQSLPLSKDVLSNDMLVGSAVVFGQKVIHFATAGLRGVPYILRCNARTSLGSIATAEIKLKIFSQEGQRARII